MALWKGEIINKPVTDYDVWGWTDGTVVKNIVVMCEPKIHQVLLDDSQGPQDYHWVDLMDYAQHSLSGLE